MAIPGKSHSEGELGIHEIHNNSRIFLGVDLNDERLLDEITELNQQVNSLVLPRYRMPLLLRKQDNYMVAICSILYQG